MISAREMTARDRAYVACTWARSSRYRLRTRESFRLVNHLLDRPTVRVVVLATNPITVHAWAAGEDDVLHYVYVPPELRGEGLAERAITELFGQYADHIDVTHAWPRASQRFRFLPHALMRGDHEAA